MSKKKFVLRVDEEIYDAIEKWAQDEFRSVNGQIEWMLNHVLLQSKRKGVKKIKIDNTRITKSE